METESTKSGISDISATPTMKSMMSTVSQMTGRMNESANFVKMSEE